MASLGPGILGLWACALGGFAQNNALPRFEDYPVTKIFHGKPAAPILATAEERRYRTRIRVGVGLGDFTNYGMLPPKVNFAGRYFVVAWGCGSPCLMMAIVDAITGKIYKLPMSDGHSVPTLNGVPFPRIEFQVNSKLMIMTPVSGIDGAPLAIYYFLWENNKWTLIRKIPCGPKGSATACEK